MAITYPVDLLDGFPGWTVEFDLLWRQEQSRTAGGKTIVKNLGDPLWSGAWASTSLSPDDLDAWKARLAALENGIGTFKGYALSRCRPIAHPGSAGLPSGTVTTINVNRKAIKVTGFTDIALSVGDMLRIGTADLHQVMEAASGSPTGEFEIRPHLWPGVATSATVSINRPYCIMQIVPGSVSAQADIATGRGTISFRGIEVR